MANWNTSPDWVPLAEINKGIEVTAATGFLASDQNKIVENLQFLYNHMSAQHVYIGNISTVTGAEKTDANVVITSRSVQDLNSDDVEVYLDFVFTIPRGTSAKFGTPVASAHELDVGASPTVAITATGDDEHKVFDFDFGIPRGSGPRGYSIASLYTTREFTIGKVDVFTSDYWNERSSVPTDELAENTTVISTMGYVGKISIKNLPKVYVEWRNYLRGNPSFVGYLYSNGTIRVQTAEGSGIPVAGDYVVIIESQDNDHIGDVYQIATATKSTDYRYDCTYSTDIGTDGVLGNIRGLQGEIGVGNFSGYFNSSTDTIYVQRTDTQDIAPRQGDFVVISDSDDSTRLGDIYLISSVSTYDTATKRYECTYDTTPSTNGVNGRLGSIRGEKGETGRQGNQGNQGPKGDQGNPMFVGYMYDSGTIRIRTTSTETVTPAIGNYVAISDAATSSNIGNIYKIASVTDIGNDLGYDCTYNTNLGVIGNIRGATGAQGPQGEKGDKGDTGPTANLDTSYGTSTSSGYTQTYINSINEKNLYNLGAFDTFKDNGDGTATIHRKTGYYKVTADTTVNHNWEDLALISIKIPNANYVTAVISNYKSFNSNDYVSYGSVIAVCNLTENDDGIGLRITTNGVTGDATTKMAILVNAGIVIQYELSDSEAYTETILLNQPIHTLNQDMELRVREEVEKGLNLFNWDGTKSYVSQYAWTFVAITEVEVGNAYTFSCTTSQTISGNGGLFLFQSDSYPTSSAIGVSDGIIDYGQLANNGMELATYEYSDVNVDRNVSTTFIPSKKYVILGITVRNSKAVNVDKVMLTKGTIPYPYQPYNGAIIHQKDLDEITEELQLTLLWENGSTSSEFSGGDITLSEAITNYKYIVIEYVENLYIGMKSNIIQHRKFRTGTSYGYTTMRMKLFGYSPYDADGDMLTRYIGVKSDTQLYVFGGYNGSTSNNWVMVPIKIYGTNIL
jgi:hypothetical protein